MSHPGPGFSQLWSAPREAPDRLSQVLRKRGRNLNCVSHDLIRSPLTRLTKSSHDNAMNLVVPRRPLSNLLLYSRFTSPKRSLERAATSSQGICAAPSCPLTSTIL